MINDTLFLLRSELTNIKGSSVDHCSFERLVNIRFLREAGRDMPVYNKELDIHYYNILNFASIYEIETVDFFIKASSRLSKAQEFIRRLNYRYDWMQVKVKTQNMQLSIINTDELKNRWVRLKNAVLKDYKGDVVIHALEKIDKRFENQEEIISSLSRYFCFGLIFPGIPLKHRNENWIKSRFIEFSEYENEKFEEYIEYLGTVKGEKIYAITGNTQPGSQTVLSNYKGNISLEENNIFPIEASVRIEFNRDDVINQWSFNLLRYN